MCGDQPTRPGWYWFRSAGSAWHVVWVYETYTDDLAVNDLGRCWNLAAEPPWLHGAEFFGPLPRPREPVINRLFAWCWRHRLDSGDRVIRVLGWRSALIETRSGCRRRATFIFQLGPWLWN